MYLINLQILLPKTTFFSDHKYITGTYNLKDSPYQQKYFLQRNFNESTKHNIETCIDNSPLLNNIFNSNDPNYIAETLQLELNTIYNTLAPSKLVQVKHNYVPYYNESMREKIYDCNQKLTNAIRTHSPDDWRAFRTERATLNKDIKVLKTEYLKKQNESKP